jgi:GNAT superfamily N-acetyltransferase
VFTIRNVHREDVPAFIPLYARYCRELFGIETTLTSAVLERDGFGCRFDIVLAEGMSNRLVGFAAWQNGYDLHWGICGGIVLDLYVEPESRGRGIGPRMLSRVARLVQDGGGVFLAGQGVTGTTRPARLYQKAAVGNPGVDCILGGKAFRAFADLDSKPLREFIKGLPPKDWNYLP